MRSIRKPILGALALVCVALLSGCHFLPGIPLWPTDREQADARMEQTAEAVNDHDTAALKAMFSPFALEKATDIDEALEYFLSFFPNGMLNWESDALHAQGSNSYGIELLMVPNSVYADGRHLEVYFADLTVDWANPDNVGLFGLGVTPATERGDPERDVGFGYWCGGFGLDDNGEYEIGEYGYLGVYVPRDEIVYPSEQGDARMEQIAAALNGQDAAALAAMFSARALDRAAGFDQRLDSLLAIFPNGGITWEQRTLNSSWDWLGEGTTLLTGQYKVTSEGKDYSFFFAEFTMNSVDPGEVGVAAMGISPWTETGAADRDIEFDEFSNSWISDYTGPTGIYVPQG